MHTKEATLVTLETGVAISKTPRCFEEKYIAAENKHQPNKADAIIQICALSAAGIEDEVKDMVKTMIRGAAIHAATKQCKKTRNLPVCIAVTNLILLIILY